jgi:hypothetical protein
LNHARLGPSNHRWPNCPGSLREEARYPYEASSPAAIDGTGSHELLELCLKGKSPAASFDQLIIGQGHCDMPFGWLVDQERCKRVQICLDYVERRVKELNEQFPGCIVTVESESKSDPGQFFGRSDWWGTVDITITASINGLPCFIEVVDYKDGRGYVSEKWNSQLIGYLFGKISPVARSIQHVRMTIVQPKTGTPIRYMSSDNPDHGFTTHDIVLEATRLSNCATATDDPNAPLVSGKHCQWCKANPKRGGHCTATTEKSISVINNTPGDNILGILNSAVADVKSLTVEQLTQIADAEDGFSAAFAKVKSEIQERIEMGESVPGFAILPGRASRVWNESDEIIAKKLRTKRLKKDEIYPSKLISPAAVMKLSTLTDAQKKKIEKELISEVSGKLGLKKVAYEKQKKEVDVMFADIPVSFL